MRSGGILLIITLFPGKFLFHILLMLFWMNFKVWRCIFDVLDWVNRYNIFIMIFTACSFVGYVIAEIVERRAERNKKALSD